MKKFKIALSLLLTACICLLVGGMAGQHAFMPIAAILFVGSVVVSIGMPGNGIAYSICGNITKGQAPDCANPMVGGVEVVLWLANRADVASVTYAAGNLLIATGITMTQNTVMPYGTLVGTFTVGEIVVGTTSAATGMVVSDTGTVLTVASVTGVFTVGGEALTGNTSGATAVSTSAAVVSTKFYAYEGIKTSNDAKTGTIKGKYMTNFDHELDMIVWKVDGDTKKELDAMARGILVGIVEYKYKGANGASAFEIHGIDQGLEVLKLDRDSTNKDNEGAYSVQLKTIAGYSEPHLPRAFFLTNYATTKALIVALT